MKVNRIIPTLSGPDLEAAIAFYTDGLGFKLEWSWGEPPTHASVSLGDAEIHLTKGEAGPSPGFRIYLWVDDVDKMYKSCIDSGITTSGEPQDKPWGMREFNTSDLNGYGLRFGGRLAHRSRDLSIRP